MDLSVTRQPVYVNEVIYDGQAEQGVEFDYTLPDYYPDIFNILKCTLKPKISSYSLSGDKLICDGVVCITVLYMSEENGDINCVEHRYTYSKTIDLPKSCEKAVVSITPKTDYSTCRAVSGRRIDVRGAVSFKIKVTAGRYSEIISSAEGCGVQLKTTPVLYGGNKITAQKQYIVREDIESTDTKGTVKAVISSDAVSIVNECKVVADKVVLKGEASVKALYLCENEGKISFESLEAEIPLSQIIDADGITEKHTCYSQFKVLSCDVSVKQSDENGTKIFGCELTIESLLTASCEETINPVTDAYSTDYDSTYTMTQIKAEASPRYITQQIAIKERLTPDNPPESVVDCRCDIFNIIGRVKSTDELAVSGTALYQCILRTENGLPSYCEKSQPFEMVLPMSNLTEQFSFEPHLQVGTTSYSIDSDGCIEIRANVLVNGCLYQNKLIDVIKEISIDKASEKAKCGDYPLKLYFCAENEDVWNIAKRYNTSADAIISENCDDDGERNCGILLIPMV